MNACKIRRGSKGWSKVMRTKAALNDAQESIGLSYCQKLTRLLELVKGS